MHDQDGLQYDYRESVPYWIITTAHLIERELNEVLSPLGMTFRQAEVLAAIAVEGRPMSQAEVAEKLGVEAPTLAGIVARMEAAGWIVRDSCPDDRRKKLIRPTERVYPVWQQVMERARGVRARLASGFSPHQIYALIAILEGMQNNLDGERRPTGPGPSGVSGS